MALNYTSAFTAAATVTRTGATHGLGTRHLRVQVYDTLQAGAYRRIWPQIRVDPSTFDVTLTFLQGVPGVLVLNGACPALGPQGNYGTAFTATPTYTLLGSVHQLGTAPLLVDVYDSAGRWLPFTPVSIDPSTYDVTLSFAQAQTGYVVVCAAADTGGTLNTGVTFTAQTSLSLPEATYPFGTRNKGVQVYDTTGMALTPQIVVDPSTWEVTVQFLQATSGLVVLNGSQKAHLLLAALLGASATPASARILQRQLTAALGGASATPASASTTQRGLSATVAGASTTPASSRLLTRVLSAQVAGASATPASASTTQRRLTSVLVGASTTPAAVGTMGTLRSLTAGLPGVSLTPLAAQTQQRALTSVLVGVSTTPPAQAQLAVQRVLLASVVGLTTTPTSPVLVQRQLLAQVTATSTTPPALATMGTLRALLATLAGVSATPDAQSQVVRPLAASLSGTSATPAASALLQRQLVASLGATSTTPAASGVMGMLRLCAALLAGTSSTPASAALLTRHLLSLLQGQSLTLDVTIHLGAPPLRAALQGASVTSTPRLLPFPMLFLTAALVGSTQTPAAFLALQPPPAPPLLVRDFPEVLALYTPHGRYICTVRKHRVGAHQCYQ